MKFSKTLKEKQVQEWRKKYLAYEHLKSIMHEPERCFLSAVKEEVAKVERFYKVLERGAERGLSNLLELFPYEKFPNIHNRISQNRRFTLINTKPTQQKRIKLAGITESRLQKKREKAALELYLALSKILRYRDMNITGFRKILKKFDKRNNTSTSEATMKEIRGNPAFTSSTTEEALEIVKYIHKQITPEKKRGKAKRLVVDLTQTEEKGDGKSFFAGLTLSAGAFMFFLRIIKTGDPWYSVLALCNWMLFSLAVVFYTCRKNFVNHSLILEVGHKPEFTISRYVLLLSMSVFMQGSLAYLQVPWYATYGITVLLALNPVNCLYRGIRYYFINTFFHMLSCAFVLNKKVRFKHFFVADHVVSMRPLLVFLVRLNSPGLQPAAMYTVFCINTVPIVVRVSQCIRRHLDGNKRHLFPHIYNLVKYMTVFFADSSMLLVDQIGFPCALVFMLVSQTYSLVWDVLIDWMLWERPKVYPPILYVGACVLDVTVRVVSILLFILKRTRFIEALETDRTATFALCVAELLRRTIWGVIRMEVEHLNNCDRLKAISGPLNDLFYLEKIDQ